MEGAGLLGGSLMRGPLFLNFWFQLQIKQQKRNKNLKAREV